MTHRLPMLAMALRQESNMFTKTEGSLSVKTKLQMKLANVEQWFMFISPEYSKNHYLDKLRRDRPIYLVDSLESRIAFARNLTLAWLLMVSALSSMDYFLTVVEDDVDR